MKYKEIGEALEKLQQHFIEAECVVTIHCTKDEANILHTEKATVKDEK